MTEVKQGHFVIVILLIVIIGIPLYLGCNFLLNKSKSPYNPPSCTFNFECLPRLETYCESNYSVCNFTTFYNCTNSQCVPFRCQTACNYCPYGCLNGECLSFSNRSDLIVYRVMNYSNSVGENVTVIVTIKNIGPGRASPSVTMGLVGTTIFLMDTPALNSGETETLPPFFYNQPKESKYFLKITADANRQVDEINEDNNDFEFYQIMGL
jgi:hypothetical protein